MATVYLAEDLKHKRKVAVKVLFEMLAGDASFVASSAQAVFARHVTDAAPPVTTVRPGAGEGF